MVTYDGRYAISQTAKRMKMLGGDDWINYRKDWVLLPDRQNIIYGYFQTGCSSRTLLNWSLPEKSP